LRVEAPPRHVPVLLSEVIEALAPKPGQILLDCTAGLGGHAAAMAGSLGSGVVVLNDADPGNLQQAARAVSAANPQVTIVQLHGNFADAPRRLAEAGLAADVVLADLGFSSNQVEAAARGFSFQRDGPLDMRLDPTSPVTAADLIASTPEAELAHLIREFGEEPAAGTTGQLADIVRSVVGRRPGAGAADPATRTFQAVRIAVNDELGSLGALLAAVERGAKRVASGEQAWIKTGARVAVISFHSLEDRPVKRSFAGLVSSGVATQVSRRPIEATEAETMMNPRSRSAKLRTIRLRF
jgi:16S rRNA (cytosine1402-N4)-methyltransferase